MLHWRNIYWSGATAADNVDGNISSRIVVAGDAVNVNVAGTYIITYNVKMLHLMQQLKRTVVVTAAGGAGGGVSADGIWQWMGTLRLANTSGWTTFVDAAGASFRASTTSAGLAVIQVT
jgi:sugar phosphate isomerase/epimerase